MRMVIVYDNVADKPFKKGWGFSCYFRDTNILFDTGESGEALLYNMEHLGIDVREIKKVVLSHDHFDHAGGLRLLKRINRDMEVFVPSGFSKWKLIGIKNYTVVLKPMEIEDGYIVSGGLDTHGFEQVLLVRTNKGIVIVTGCAHPGIDRIINFAKGFGKIHGIIGGFHGFSEIELLRDIDIVMPCHCTRYKEQILLMKNGKECKVGEEITIE